MNDDDLERLLSGAFDAQAREAVPDSAVPPPPRFADHDALGPDAGDGAGPRHRAARRRRVLAPLAAAAAVVAAVSVGAVALRSGDDHPVASNRRTTASTLATTPTPSANPNDVHVKLFSKDGLTYGVGMPVIAFFSQRITDGSALQSATTATVDGTPVKVAWYFQNSGYQAGYPIEAHLRPEGYWPAHATVHVNIPVKGLSAGKGLVFDDSLTSTWRTGAKTVSVVNNRTHTITVTSDKKTYGTFPISLGAPTTPTYSGTKVVMEQVPTVCMQDTARSYHDCGIKWDQRVTYTGEYLHAAPWNCSSSRGDGCTGPYNNIGSGNSSNGCTNLRPTDAEKLYHFMRIGDVVKYPNADGPPMPMSAGYSDWNVSWAQWRTGGVVPTT